MPRPWVAAGTKTKGSKLRAGSWVHLKSLAIIGQPRTKWCVHRGPPEHNCTMQKHGAVCVMAFALSTAGCLSGAGVRPYLPALSTRAAAARSRAGFHPYSSPRPSKPGANCGRQGRLVARRVLRALAWLPRHRRSIAVLGRGQEPSSRRDHGAMDLRCADEGGPSLSVSNRRREGADDDGAFHRGERPSQQ